jgi:hypothetical protein
MRQKLSDQEFAALKPDRDGIRWVGDRPYRPDRTEIKVSPDEWGGLEFFGPLAVRTLKTPDPLGWILKDFYMAGAPASMGMSPGDWVLVSASIASEFAECVLLVVGAVEGGVDTAKERKARSRLRLCKPGKVRMGWSAVDEREAA